MPISRARRIAARANLLNVLAETGYASQKEPLHDNESNPGKYHSNHEQRPHQIGRADLTLSVNLMGGFRTQDQRRLAVDVFH